jgi:putative ABC transport system permease protein
MVCVEVFSLARYQTMTGEGEETLRVEIGDYSDADLDFLTGSPPQNGEIALVNDPLITSPVNPRGP